MSLILDLICLLLLAGGFAIGWSRSPLSSGLTLLSAVLALTGAFFPQYSGGGMGIGNRCGSASGTVGGQ